MKDIEHLRTWQWGALVALCLLLYLPGFFTIPPFDRDEARFAQASRQMVESGDYVNIRFQNEARLKKPAGIYWLQAASARLFGTSAGGTSAGPAGEGIPDHPEIWPYRVPSLLGALLAVLATAWTGCRLFGARAGFAAGLMLAGCVVLGTEARMAKTDAVLLATVVLAQGALARLWLERNAPERPGWSLPLLFWSAIGAGILIKGPIGPMVSAITVAGLCLWERRCGWLGRLRPLLGLVVVAALVSPWLIAISLATHGQFFAESVGHDLMAKVASGQEGKGLPPGYFLVSFWLTFAPFALPAALAAPWVWANRRDPTVLFCLVWLVPTWLVFEAVPTKLLHYTLPTFPAIALLTARAALDGFGRSEDRLRPRLFAGAALLAGLGVLVLAGGSLALPWVIDGRILVLPSALALVALGVLGVALVLLWRRRQAAALGWALAGQVLLAATCYQLVLPRLEGLWLSREIADRVAEVRPCPGTTLAAAGYSEPSLVFLLGAGTRFGTGDVTAQHLRADPVCALSLVDGPAEALFRQWLQGQPVQPLAVIQGFNYSRGKRQTLTLYRATP